MHSKPIRIQRKRTRGWKMPPNTVYVGRPTKWGNPVRVKKGSYILTAENAKECYRTWLTKTEGRSIGYHAGFELRGKNLACWCKLGEPCHADVLLEIANQ